MKSTVLRSTMGKCAVVVFLAVASGCASTTQRNSRSTALAVVRSPYDSAGVEFILETEQTREQIPSAELEAFLASAESSSLSRPLKDSLRRRHRLIEATCADLAVQSSREVVLAKPDKDRPLSEDNVVAYLRGESGSFYAYCSLDEIGAAFVRPRMETDLKTIRFIGSQVEDAVLSHLRTELREADIEVPEARLSRGELKELRTLTAAGILERTLREGKP